MLFTPSSSALVADAVQGLQSSLQATHNWHTSQACAHTCCIGNSAVQDLGLLAVCLEECEGAHAEAEATQVLLQHAAACQCVKLVHSLARIVVLCAQSTHFAASCSVFRLLLPRVLEHICLKSRQELEPFKREAGGVKQRRTEDHLEASCLRETSMSPLCWMTPARPGTSRISISATLCRVSCLAILSNPGGPHHCQVVSCSTRRILTSSTQCLLLVAKKMLAVVVHQEYGWSLDTKVRRKRMAAGPVCTLLRLLGPVCLSWRRHIRADMEDGLVSWRPTVRVHPAAHRQPPHQRLAHHAILSLRAKQGFRSWARWCSLYTMTSSESRHASTYYM